MEIKLRHLVWQDSCYHFRYVIPADIRSYVGCREMKRSLHTQDAVLAQAEALRLGTIVKQCVGLIRKVAASAMDEQEKRDFIRRFVALKLKADLDFHERYRTQREQIPPQQAGMGLEDMKAWLKASEQQLVTNDLSQLKRNVQHFAQMYFAEEAVALANDPAFLQELTREVQKARIAMAEVEVSRGKGDYGNPFDDVKNKLFESLREPKESAGDGTPSRTLKELVDQYVEEHESGGNWNPKTALMVRSAFRDLIEIIGSEVDITSITRKKLTDFRSKIMKLPANRGKLKPYREKSIAEILTMSNVNPMSPKSIQNRMTWTTSFFKWCARNDYIPKNPAEGLVPPKLKQRASEQRDAFTKKELQKFIDVLSEHREEMSRREERFWIPLIALYSGMRQNEICQLHCDDIKTVDGVWCFDVNENTEDKNLKSSASKRTVPIHPKLIDLGLLDYVKIKKGAGAKRLWPNLKYHSKNGYGRQISRWFSGFCDEHIVDDPKKVFHSFRHNFTNTLKQMGVQEVTITELTGHENDSITTGRYGKPFEPKPLLEAIEKLDYGLDLSPLKEGKP